MFLKILADYNKYISIQNVTGNGTDKATAIAIKIIKDYYE
jgi:hypothetical protein